jgi:hypothetical protein
MLSMAQSEKGAKRGGETSAVLTYKKKKKKKSM